MTDDERCWPGGGKGVVAAMSYFREERVYTCIGSLSIILTRFSFLGEEKREGGDGEACRAALKGGMSCL